MHEPLLSMAALPAPVAVLGMPLRPYSLGHELYLIREGNPLAAGSPHANRFDLTQAVLICCQSWEESRLAHRDPLIRLKLWAWNRRARKLDTQTELKAFLDYQQSGTLEFKIDDTARPDRESPRLPGAPFLLRLHAFLMERLRINEAQAWDYHYGLAVMRWEAHWEQEGGLYIYNAHDAVFDQHCAEMEAKGLV